MVTGLLGQSVWLVCAITTSGHEAAANAYARNAERFIVSSLSSLGDEERQRHLFVDRFESHFHAQADLEVAFGDAAQRRVDPHAGIHVDQRHDVGRGRLEEEVEGMMADRPSMDRAAGRRLLEGAL